MNAQNNHTNRLSAYYELWDQLANVIVDSDGCITSEFLHFDVGTHRETIWRWFESRHPDFVVGEVMQGIRRADCMATNKTTQEQTAKRVHEYAFDIKLLSSVRVKATSLHEARVKIRKVFDVANCTGGAWDDGSPVHFAATIDGDLDLLQIDGVDVD